jgi:transcriptional regulator with XRE-family HTH domain
MTLADRIDEAIQGSKKTRADIARACGVTQASVTFWLDGTTKSLKAETALALEQATGYRALWILKGLGPRKVEAVALAWPFPKVPLERIEALDEDDRGYVQKRLLQAVEECDAPHVILPIDKTVVGPVRRPLPAAKKKRG